MFEVDRDRAGQVEAYIESHASDFSIVDFMEEHHLFEARVDKGDQINAKCPFHADKNPSFFVSVSKNRFNCFSCNRNGGYLRFLTVYKNELERHELSYYDVMDMVLKQHTEVQRALGFSSIFRSQFELVTNFRKMDLKIHKTPRPDSYSELYTFMRKEGFIKEAQIKYAILSMQSGRTPSDILSTLRGESVLKERVGANPASIMDILNSDD